MRTAFAALAAMAILGIARTQAPYDVVIRNGRVLDGTGASWFRADIAIKGDTIVRIARTITEPATRVMRPSLGLYLRMTWFSVSAIRMSP